MSYEKLNQIDSATRQGYESLAVLEQLLRRPIPIGGGLESSLEHLEQQGLVREETTGMLWWKQQVYVLSTTGKRVVDTEKQQLQRIASDLRRAKTEHPEAIMSRYGTNPDDYQVRQMIFSGYLKPDDFKTPGLGIKVAKKARPMPRRESTTSRDNSSPCAVYTGIVCGFTSGIHQNDAPSSQGDGHSCASHSGDGGVAHSCGGGTSCGSSCGSGGCGGGCGGS